MTRKCKGILYNKEGNGMPLAAAVTLGLLMLVLVIIQFARLMIVCAGVKDAMQEAVISTINDNYADVYHAVREGYAAGYQPTDGSFEESLDYGDIYGRLDGLLGLEEDSGYHCKVGSNGATEFRITDLKVYIHNAGLASGDTSSFEAEASVRLEVPISFLKKVLPDMKITVWCKAAYTPKF
ncbi:MAG: hypothetical protein J1E98_00590 [Lachnospiraceae bacterium]|nr:hypothetical protein [Lachnospiraceae bacterium]